MSELHALAERLEKATGEDRALDGLLAVLDGWEWHGDGGVERHAVCAGHWVSPESPTNGSFGKRGPRLCDCPTISERFGNTEDAPAYTSSIDAAVALCERNGWRIYTLDASIPGQFHWMLASAEKRERYDDEFGRIVAAHDYASGRHSHPALALCLAVVRAKIAATPASAAETGEDRG